MSRYTDHTMAGQGFDTQLAETLRRLQAGETFTVKELAQLLDISTSRCGDILNELVRRGHASHTGRPRKYEATSG